MCENDKRLYDLLVRFEAEASEALKSSRAYSFPTDRQLVFMNALDSIRDSIETIREFDEMCF